MSGCPKCREFSGRFNIASPREYLEIVRQRIDAVNRGAFVLVHASCPLADLFKTPWPGDCITHEFRCAACGRSFELSADPYHGGASWTPKNDVN